MQSPDKSIEELLKIVEGSTKSSAKEGRSPPVYNDDIINFILDNKIKGGTKVVPSLLIYKIYLSWSRNPVTIREFNVRMKEYFNSKNGPVKYYLHQDAITLSAKVYESIYYERERALASTNSRIVEFLTGNNFKRGDKYFRGYVFFEMFLEWARPRKYHKVAYYNFLKVMKRCLNHKIDSNHTNFFGINQNLRESYLTEQKEAFLKKKYRKNNEKSFTKKQKKERSPRSKI